MRRFIITVVRLLPVVAGASVIAIAGLWLVRHWIVQADLDESSDVVGNYLQTIGTIYAVLLAFVVQSVWTQFNEARVLVEREANEVADLHRLTDGLPDKSRVPLQTALRSYVDKVIEKEWHAMAKGDEDTIELIGKELDAVWDGLHELEPCTECEKSLHGEALNLDDAFSGLWRVSTAPFERARRHFGVA